jgi:hypothetical protein
MNAAAAAWKMDGGFLQWSRSEQNRREERERRDSQSNQQ